MSEPRLVELVAELEAAGFPHELSVRKGGRVKCGKCGVDTPADVLRMEERLGTRRATTLV